jgi:F-type H+-transporting ATPase subunit alpha
MKQVAGTLRLDLASYRELQAFSQFGSDLDKATLDELNRGARMTELLKQPRYQPMHVEDQVMAIFAGNNGFLDPIPVSDVLRYRSEMLQYMRTVRPEIGQKIVAEGKISDETSDQLKEALTAFGKQFSVGDNS